MYAYCLTCCAITLDIILIKCTQSSSLHVFLINLKSQNKPLWKPLRKANTFVIRIMSQKKQKKNYLEQLGESTDLTRMWFTGSSAKKSICKLYYNVVLVFVI